MIAELKSLQTQSFFIPVKNVMLTPVQKIILQKIADGDELREVSACLGKSDAFVSMNLYRARQINGAKSNTNLIVMAMRNGKIK